MSNDRRHGYLNGADTTIELIEWPWRQAMRYLEKAMTNPERAYVWVEDRSGTRLPYSKGLLASSMMVIGIPPGTAYAIAETVEAELAEDTRDHLAVDDLVKIAERTLADQASAAAATRFANWVQARRSAQPMVLLLGGATGVGKSTIAAAVGSRLGITRVVPTDAVREVMRSALPRDIVPSLQVSSFEAHRLLRAPIPEDHDPVVVGFRQQAEIVGTGLRRLVNGAIREGIGLIVEGVHVLPGLFKQDLPDWEERATVCRAVLTVSDADVHRAHLLTRLERAPGREPQRYLDQFSEIRRIQRYIVQLTQAANVPQVPVESLDEAIQSVLGMVVTAVTRGRAESDEDPDRESVSAG